MSRRSRRNIRRRKEQRRQRLIIALGLLLLITLTAVGIKAFWPGGAGGRSRPAVNSLEDQTSEGWNASVISSESSAPENSEASGETAPESIRQSSGGEETAEMGESTAEESTAEKSIAEESTAGETKPKHLESLSGLPAGTILDPSQINFDDLDRYFMSWEIEEGDNLYQRINGKSYQANDYVPLSTLRYLKMPHYNFKGQIQVGEMIVNKDVMGDVFQIFKELFRAEYQIQSMYLVDNYWTGDPDTSDSASIDENNTSAFCYRRATGGGKLSNHAYGRAIDLNPQQNPYVSYSTGSPKWSHENANDYIARDTGLPHVITHSDLAYKLFTKHGFRWGGDWNNPKDYQHFDKNK